MAADILAAYNKAVSFGGAPPANKNMHALRQWIIAAGGPTLNDLQSQSNFIFAFAVAPPHDGGGGDGGGGGP